MQCFRVFDWDGSSLGRSERGPFFIARGRQGAGRHDAPAIYGAWYCSLDAVSAVAECIQYLRGHVLRDADFSRVGGTTKAIVRLHVDDRLELVNLDDPVQLVKRHLPPSQVATMRRAVTQQIAASVFQEGAAGLQWWSTLDAEWTNVTLFCERAIARVSMPKPPQKLSIRLPVVQQAARHLGIEV